MAYGLNAHRYRHPEFLHFQTEQGLRTAGIIVITLLLVAIFFVGISLIEVTNSLLPRP
jgi:hypothetical protein